MQKKTLIFLRFFLILCTILLMTYSKKGVRFPEPGYIIAFFYFLSNLVLYRIPDKFLMNSVGSFFVFLFDIIAISLAVYFTQGFDSDFYLAYFLVIFLESNCVFLFHFHPLTGKFFLLHCPRGYLVSQ